MCARQRSRLLDKIIPQGRQFALFSANVKGPPEFEPEWGDEPLPLEEGRLYALGDTWRLLNEVWGSRCDCLHPNELPASRDFGILEIAPEGEERQDVTDWTGSQILIFLSMVRVLTENWKWECGRRDCNGYQMECGARLTAHVYASTLGADRDLYQKQMTAERIRQAFNITKGHMCIREKARGRRGEDGRVPYYRLEGGLVAWHTGMLQEVTQERLYQFARVFEAATPEDTRGRETLIKRLSPFFRDIEPKLRETAGLRYIRQGSGEKKGGSSDEEKDVRSVEDHIEMLWLVRNKIVHLSHLDLVIPNFQEESYSTSQSKRQGDMLERLSVRAEVMASWILCEILSRSDLLSAYENEKSTNELFEGSLREEQAGYSGRPLPEGPNQLSNSGEQGI